MAIDLFGQNTTPLPSPPSKYRRGPDWQHGPPRCRQNQQLCEYDQKQPHDHSCCCDPCRHNYINICTSADGPIGCCRCVPKAICLKFTPDEPTDVCKVLTWKLSGGIVAQRGVKYEVNITGIGLLTIFVGFPDLYNELFGVAPCIWQITAPEISVDQSVAVDHSGAIHCQSPPEWTIEGVTIPRGDSSCTGTLSLAQYELAKLPFVSRWWDFPETFVTGLSCGSCSQFCQILCVRRGDAESHTRVEFIWNDTDTVWRANDNSGHFISLHEEYGNCYFLLEELGTSEFEGDLLLIDSYACSLGMDLTATGEGTNFISVSCNRCSCWKYVCGTCRCLCQKLCVVGMLGGEEVRRVLDWDYYNWRWGDDTFNVTLSTDSYDNCQVTVTGFEGSVAIRNDCGSQIVFNVTEDVSDMLASGEANYLYGFCQQCEGSCDQGSCLELCDDVPPVVYCELTPADWDLMLGCDPYDLCFSPVTIPMFLVFVGTEAAGEWRWIGKGIISCHDCSPLSTPRNFLVTIDYGCDGNGRFTVENPDIPFAFTYDFTSDLPCGYADVWAVTFYADSTGGNGPPDGCCDLAGWHGLITT